jgi:cytidyltransferase-like protein
MTKTIGIIGGAFKPFHSGHYATITKMANENDEVVLFVSNKNRIRKGEFPILWDNMETVWKKYLEKHLPKNVSVVYVDNPITATYNLIEDAEKTDSPNIYTVYASGEDLQSRFADDKLKKHFPKLYSNDQLFNKETGTRGVMSGTKMREHLKNDNFEEFISGLPEPVQALHGMEIWTVLKRF